ncbi:hypothetical protein ABG79_00139 [Caloramator mitchellensis]|uniref:Uncharacterized protein n=1 Tax=Caloramator mitchellensis TaxID=908809 RepID=A0A0R3JWN5_CALMK|nr:hypothetical protein [Caloramator mitchellensis]KRQ87974.1 hypothetical protein ABG79_00139 [Caloramator mitchellensis]
MDKFYEQLLTTSKNSSYKTLHFIMIFSIIFATFYLFLTILTFSGLYLVSAVLVAILSYVFKVLRDKQYKEFEYIFTNGNLQIDVIYNKSKRKTLFDEEVKNFEAFNKLSELKISNNVERIKCIPFDYKGETYAVLTLGGRRAILIAPDDEMLKLINMYNIRRR